MKASVVIQEHSFRRLIIDVDCLFFREESTSTLVFNTEDAAETAGKVVEAWIKEARLGNRYDTTQNGMVKYLPDLILKHAHEWGLQ